MPDAPWGRSSSAKQLNLSRFYAISQIKYFKYCRNCIFKRNFPIHKLFERSCEFGLWHPDMNTTAKSVEQPGVSLKVSRSSFWQPWQSPGQRRFQSFEQRGRHQK
jgi:hypothetical protein